MPVIPATREAEAGEALEPRNGGCVKCAMHEYGFLQQFETLQIKLSPTPWSSPKPLPSPKKTTVTSRTWSPAPIPEAL
ncbi:hypothetical protein AAY473_010167 [Plecturocebus cupreus]